jgi:hypothetical protein
MRLAPGVREPWLHFSRMYTVSTSPALLGFSELRDLSLPDRRRRV